MVADSKRTLLLLPLALLLVVAACSSESAPAAPSPADTSMAVAPSMGSMAPMAQSQDLAPGVKGYAKGGEVLFLHTEASDPQVAAMLTRMMGPQVVEVPRLAQVPEAVLGKVYVFTNGLSGGGPLGFQQDVFDSVPGDADYTPLRAIHLVSWKAGAVPRELRSAEEVRGAEVQGQVTITRTGAVVNMPVLSWPGGHR
jgi:hypothetical protein